MNIYSRIAYAIITTAALLMPSCRPKQNESHTQPVVIEDAFGRKVSLPANPERIVGLRPGALRLLAYMNLCDRVAGVEQVEKNGDDRPYVIAHPELLQLPFIGARGGNNELIMSVNPDVIFMTYTSVADADAMEKLTGIPVVALEYPEMGLAAGKLFASLKIIGKIMDKEERADSLTEYISQSLNDLHNRTSGIDDAKKPTVYIGGIAHGRARNITSTHPDYPPFIFTNAKNVADAVDKEENYSLSGVYIDIEQLMTWNPDIIFIDESGLNLVNNDINDGGALANHLTAIKTGRIYTLPSYNSYAVNYETALINSWFVGKTMYPDAFEDISIEEKANEILTVFLGKPIYNEWVTLHSFKSLSYTK
ncbi:MAG: iron ABC transporter substrate-binding protein [Prevotellaceae bacterium]|nr:iron ABC transporter substrate-binding protein [Prevotellaceae bacterium]